jgi:hypothetical protein
LQGLGENICPHLFSRAVLKINFARVAIVTNKEIFRLNIFGPFGAGNVAIYSQGEGAHVVLIDDVYVDLVTLGFEELTSPMNITYFVIKANDFTFARTLCWYFVFGGRTGSCTTAKRKD